MKKLLLALAIASASMVVSAATANWNWTTSGLGSSQVIYAKDGTTTLYTANNAAVLYLFDAGVVSQDSLLSSLRNGNTIDKLTSITSQSLADTSKITAKEFAYGTPETTYNYYTAVINGDDVFVTTSIEKLGQLSDTTSIAFSGLKAASSTVFADDTATFTTGGWYAIPEPTSGMLLLVGCALMALKRKRA